MIRRWFVGGLMGCCLAIAAAQNSQPAQGAQQPGAAAAKQSSGTQAKAAATTNPAMVTEGEQKFQQNCSRCHNAPEQLSPRISGTVVMHMRVRASLSEADARAILHYLAP